MYEGKYSNQSSKLPHYLGWQQLNYKDFDEDGHYVDLQYKQGQHIREHYLKEKTSECTVW